MDMTNLTWTTRPWGDFGLVHSEPGFTVKILRIAPKQALSLQYHEHRDEYWTLLGEPHPNNRPRAVVNGVALTMVPGVKYAVPRLVTHRLVHEGSSAVSILEVAVGEFDENDIVRISDRYGR